MFAFFLDLREGFHFGEPAGPTGSSRRGGAGVWARAPLCLCSGLQLCLEVEGQRRSPGDQMNPRAPRHHGHSFTPTFHARGLLSNCFKRFIATLKTAMLCKSVSCFQCHNAELSLHDFKLQNSEILVTCDNSMLLPAFFPIKNSSKSINCVWYNNDSLIQVFSIFK